MTTAAWKPGRPAGSESDQQGTWSRVGPRKLAAVLMHPLVGDRRVEQPLAVVHKRVAVVHKRVAVAHKRVAVAHKRVAVVHKRVAVAHTLGAAARIGLAGLAGQAVGLLTAGTPSAPGYWQPLYYYYCDLHAVGAWPRGRRLEWGAQPPRSAADTLLAVAGLAGRAVGLLPAGTPCAPFH